MSEISSEEDGVPEDSIKLEAEEGKNVLFTDASGRTEMPQLYLINGRKPDKRIDDITADEGDRICLKSHESEELIMLSFPEDAVGYESNTEVPAPFENNYFKDNLHIRNESVCSQRKKASSTWTEQNGGSCDAVGSNGDIVESCDGNVDDSLEYWVTKNSKTFEKLIVKTDLSRKSGCADSIFSCLPDELIVKIFSYLSTEELCLNAAKVCRKWREISHDHSLWKMLDFSSNPHLSSLNLLWVIRRAPLLHKLVLRGRSHITRAEVAIITESCPVLQDIDFGFCDNLDHLMIQTLYELCPNLHKINVEGCEKVDRKCLKYLARCKKLTHLNFSHCILIDDDGIVFLAKGLPKIISINLDGINFLTDRAVLGLVETQQEHLEEVELDGAEISDAGILELSGCRHLRHLGLSFCECLTDTSLNHLKELKNLESLRLRKGSDFTTDGLSRYFREASLSRLQYLNLSECTNIRDDVVLDMVQVCGKQLRELSLSWCWFITDRGLISIVDHCCNLETLDLLGIDKVKGECLARIPEEMPKLKFLDLRQCNQIVDNLIMDMVRQKPDLKVYNYYGEEFIHN